ncbi:MAG TPA: isoaspartyl peptidase/L-asparaginase [Myxococcota bacterium]|nr:isoaspartyl peptidase/L-asparaginase [Myxococcota bacterium]
MHGGAGGLAGARERATSEALRAGLAEALAAGAALLARGGAAQDAVVAAVAVLEDCPHFNAGTGSVLNAAGEVEMDAALMEGAKRRAGAVAGVRRLAHPIEAARAVLRDGRHVLLFGAEAERLGRAAGVVEIAPEALIVPARRAQHGRAKGDTGGPRGTVGAVARDAAGHLAAATSTGGLGGKLPGRISDSAQIGAGTWADDATCAVSATGNGELFIRTAFARNLDALLRHARLSLEDACRRALDEVAALGGHGGCIAIDREGRIAMPFDTPAMPRGSVREDESPRLALTADDER